MYMCMCVCVRRLELHDELNLFVIWCTSTQSDTHTHTHNTSLGWFTCTYSSLNPWLEMNWTDKDDRHREGTWNTTLTPTVCLHVHSTRHTLCDLIHLYYKPKVAIFVQHFRQNWQACTPHTFVLNYVRLSEGLHQALALELFQQLQTCT